MQQLPILQADNVEKIKFDSRLCGQNFREAIQELQQN